MTGAQHDAEHLPDVFAAVARALAEQEGVEQTLERIAQLAVETIPGADHAGVTQVRGRRQVRTVASTDALPEQVDAVQYEVGQGPCLDAIFEHEVVKVDDLADTDRWPDFAARASALGARSMLAFRLFVEGDTSGALNLYSGRPDAFGEDSQRLGHAFAAHAALAWQHEKESSDLHTAVQTRTLIGQAQGLLMARHGVTPDGAFDLLRTVSSHRNVKLRQVAEEVVQAGGLPAQAVPERCRLSER